MNEAPVTNGLQMHWVPVVDDRGRTHLEAVWTSPGEPVQVGVTHAA